MAEKPIRWLPIDTRFFPVNFTLKASHAPWVKALLAIEIFLAAIAVLGSIVLVFLPKPNPGTQEPLFCQKNTDCVLGTRIDKCCDGPKAYSKKAVEEDFGLALYERKLDYRQLRPRNCRQVFCSACAFFTKAICSLGTCQGITTLGAFSK